MFGSARAATPAETTFIVANTQFTVLHEVGHVMLSGLDLPFLGGEEEASDQLAAVSLLLSSRPQRDPRAADRLVVAAQGWLIEWALHQAGGHRFEYWDSHPLDIQRYYNLLCMLHGGVPNAETRLHNQLQLPYPRIWRCGDEYQRVLRSLQWISRTRGGAADARRRSAARVGVVYEKPSTPERAALHRMLLHSGVMEQSARIIETHFPLPQDISIVVANICGPTAYWLAVRQEIIVCYALLERFAWLARYQACLRPLEPRQAARRPPEEDEVAACVARRMEQFGD
ncbi:MAG TPA: DUF4344 domain-containing metallopeptidase [Solimonas sp.]|nr:DUF4344 domain-containing metallopeptidase [Solimonas sp.]